MTTQNQNETTTQKAERIFDAVTKHGKNVHISRNTDLFTVADMKAEQKEWPESDESKNVDLDSSACWLWGDGFLIGIDSASELEQYL
jgi:hypothetical protein